MSVSPSYAAQRKLTLRRTDGDVFASGAEEHVVVPPYAVVGRSPDVDVPLRDDTCRLSRSHLVLEARGGAWWGWDDLSRHGTYVVVRAQEPSQLPPGVALPLEHGMQLWLGDGAATLRVELGRSELRGGPTVEDEDGKGGRSILALAEGSRLAIAAALVKHRSVRSAYDELLASGRIKIGERQFRNVLREIAQLREVRDEYAHELWRRGKQPELDERTYADALGAALERRFPTLAVQD